MSEFDLVIRGGLVVDGSGAEPFPADVGIRDGLIAAVGPELGKGRDEIDAAGQIVTPGFVDIHTHYDAQVTWEQRLIPSSFHGVTTVVIGNCGVGFAPCREAEREQLVRLMEGVEDIPYPVLTEGLPWTWTTFPEYLDLIASRDYDMDIAAFVPHAALRVHVMGQRGADREPATAEDIAEMCRLLEEALDAGALGIATSRTIFHRSSDGKSIPTLNAADEELLAFARVLRKKGKGLFQIVEDLHLPGASLNSMRAIAREAGRPLTFSIGCGNSGPKAWPRLLDELEAANAEGLVMKGQVIPRGIGMILGFELTLNPFYTTPTYSRLVHLPLAERLVELRKPEVRAAILSEDMDPDPALVLGRMVREFDTMFLLGDPPDYEQPPERSIASLARAKGISPEEFAYDVMIEGETGGKLYLAMSNYADGCLDSVSAMLDHPDVVLGLGDGGAHVGTICDASYSTFALMHWTRDRERGRKPLADVVHRMTQATARIAGLEDRGLVAPGLRADLNVIDYDGLKLLEPEVCYDLPAGGRRLVQRSEGYQATLVKGQVVCRSGEATGALPGQLIRA
ncbi:amidohydrolase [Croceicoccus estronivorus]|uniref:N-acyl-D-amino-acid deacylase family protein n=1 Tax=Croceicoccus estronivorus TaxID=1172626 RepID=UPI000832697E|nr:amidohydrolase family protein [Croceicoccus estronivorus]OCC24446.1 amidohydrolase [Croceicoccus estronivorus]